MRFYVHDTEADAQATAEAIDQRAREVFAAQGYTIREDGAVIGKRGGVDNPEGVTRTWDIPRQRLDGKWLLLHPEEHPSATIELAPGLTVLAYVTQDVTAPVENEDAAWFPEPEV